MNKGIKDFCVKYKEKLKNDKEIADRTEEVGITDFTTRVTFYLNSYDYVPMMLPRMGYAGTNLIQLDSEDLEYFYKKYSKKLREEMRSNVEALKDEYKDLL